MDATGRADCSRRVGLLSLAEGCECGQNSSVTLSDPLPGNSL